MRRFSGVLLLGLFWVGVFAITAYAQKNGGAAPVANNAAPASADIAILFAPIVAASTGIERLLEMFWNWFEALFTNFIAFVAMGWEWMRWVREEIEMASQSINELASQLAQLRRTDVTPARAAQESVLLEKLRLAEEELNAAHAHLRSVLKSDRYRSIKQAISVLAGVALGLIVAAAADLRMFHLLGIAGVPNGVDVAVSGLVIGTGSGPVHSLIGILQQSKETVEQASSLLRGRSQLTQTEVAARSGAPCDDAPTR